MNIYSTSHFSIFWGDKKSCPVHYKTQDFSKYCFELSTKLALKNIVVLNQIHGTQGLYLPAYKASHNSFFEHDGDFLITNQKNIGLAILTADCLPIIMYDTKNHVAAAIHAGWQGTVQGIVHATLKDMKKHHATCPENIQAYFGPSARACCYEVQEDFIAKIAHLPQEQQTVIKRGASKSEKLFFDVPLCNKRQLLASGVLEKNIHEQCNACTMCSKNFHSYRREKEQALRQISVVWL